jgi:MFS family permease
MLSERKNIALHIMGYGIISGVALAVMMSLAGKQSLWLDDLIQITISQRSTFSDIINGIYNMDSAPPLFGLLAAVWFKIAPYGTAFLKLPSEIAVTVGVFICGLAGERIRNVRTGFICAILAATSSTVLYDAGMSFRAYGLFFMLSSLAILLYVSRYKHIEKETKWILAGMSLTFTLLVYTHYFGILMLAGFFLADIFLLVKRKIHWIYFIPYFVVILLYWPWLFYGLIPCFIKTKTFWPSTPNWRDLNDTIKYLGNGNVIICLLYLLGVFTIAYTGIILIIKGKFSFEKHYVYVALFFTFSFVIMITYFYSVFINPKGSIYVSRYFLGIICIYYLLAACGFDRMCYLVSKTMDRSSRRIATVAIISIITILISAITYGDFYRKVHSIHEPWEQTAEWLMAQEDIYHKNVLVVISTLGTVIGGFKYYTTHNGERKGFEIANNLDAKTLDGIDKIYYCDLHSNILNKSYMEANFSLEKNVNEVPVRIYKRITD